MFKHAFPIELYNDVSNVIKIIPTKTYNNVLIGVSKERIAYLLNDTTIEIPYRIYFLDVSDEILNKLR